MRQKHKPTDEDIIFGKMCGCGRCQYCGAWQYEQLMQQMLQEVSRGKQIAETARKELIESWRKQDGY